MKRHELTDEQWLSIEKHFRRRKRRTGRPSREARVMLNGVMWILSTGAPWRDLPERFGPWQTVYHHFRDWRKRGIFARVIEDLMEKLSSTRSKEWRLCVNEKESFGKAQSGPAAGPDDRRPRGRLGAGRMRPAAR